MWPQGFRPHDASILRAWRPTRAASALHPRRGRRNFSSARAARSGGRRVSDGCRAGIAAATARVRRCEVELVPEVLGAVMMRHRRVVAAMRDRGAEFERMQVSGSRERFPVGTDTPITQAIEVRRIGGKARVADEVACHVTGGPPGGSRSGPWGRLRGAWGCGGREHRASGAIRRSAMRSPSATSGAGLRWHGTRGQARGSIQWLMTHG